MMLLGRGGCPPGLHVVASPGVYESDDRRQVCNDTWSSFVDFVRKMRPALVVLVGDGSRFFMPLPDDYEEGDPPEVDNRSDAFRQGLGELVRSLEQYSQVAYVLEIPTFDTPPACFLRPVKLPGSQCSKSISRHLLVASRTAYELSVTELHSQHPKCSWWIRSRPSAARTRAPRPAVVARSCTATTCTSARRGAGDSLRTPGWRLSWTKRPDLWSDESIPPAS